LFGTDCPFDPQGGPLFIRETIKALDSLKLKKGDARRIYFGNATRLLRLKPLTGRRASRTVKLPGREG